MSYRIDSEQLTLITEMFLKDENYTELYKLFFDLIHNEIVSIGVKLNIRRNKPKETIYEYMEMIDVFLFNNLEIKLFKRELIQEISNLYSLREKIDLKEVILLDKRDVEKLIKTYYKLKRLKIPNIFMEIGDIEGGRYPTNQTYSSFNILFGSKSSKRREVELGDILDDMYRKNIEKESREIRNKYREGKISFEKVFTELISLKSKERLLDSNKKHKKKVEISGKLHDNLDYRLYTKQLYGFLMLSIGSVAIFYLGFLIFEYYKFPELGISLIPHIFFPVIAAFVSFFTFHKHFWKR